MPEVRLLGLGFADLDTCRAAAALAMRPADAPFAYVVTPNADHLVRLEREPGLRPLYDGAALRLLDSRVVARAAGLLGLPVPRLAPGSDLTARLLRHHLPPDERVTIVGLREARVAALVRAAGIASPHHCDPPFGFADDPAALARTVEFVLDHPARFTFLAVGSPRQEKLAAAIASTGRARGLGLCVGASLDFVSGAARRAPGWMQSAGLEWLHRLAADPRRLARRYLIDDPPIFVMLLRELLTAPA